MKVFITGITGFVGSAVARKMNEEGYQVSGQARTSTHSKYETHQLPLTPTTQWKALLKDVDIVIHCAAQVHQMNGRKDEISSYIDVNTAATINLAKQAQKEGVKRFLFISSIKVNGERSLEGVPFTEHIDSKPNDPYGLSKYLAEQQLQESCQHTGMDYVIIRPPLVYGPGVKANFLTMMNLVRKRMPIPLGSVSNKRSMIYIENLADAVVRCIEHNKAANQTFLVSDDDDVSTPRLLNSIGRHMDNKTRLIAIPESWISIGLKILKKGAIADKITGNLQLDITKIKTVLDWNPPVSFEDGMKRTVQDYLSNNLNKH